MYSEGITSRAFVSQPLTFSFQVFHDCVARSLGAMGSAWMIVPSGAISSRSK
jgi:hypothetical protein